MNSSAAASISTVGTLSEQQASEYDFILLVDRSGSMAEPSTSMKGKSRWEEAHEFTLGLARFAEKVDDDGITVITFNAKPNVFDGVKAEKVSEIFTELAPNGSTNLAPALQEAINKKFSSKKPAIILVITDGEANDPDDVKRAIAQAANKIASDEEIAIQFIQIGDDRRAARFLQELDDNLKQAKFDIVKTLTREQAEGYSIEQLLWLAVHH